MCTGSSCQEENIVVPAPRRSLRALPDLGRALDYSLIFASATFGIGWIKGSAKRQEIVHQGVADTVRGLSGADQSDRVRIGHCSEDRPAIDQRRRDGFWLLARRVAHLG